MNKQFNFEMEPFGVHSELDELSDEFNEAESDAEFEAGNACPAFTPVAVENPGGGRIKDKKIPQASDIVTVKGAFHPKVPVHRLAAAALEPLVCAARADGIKAPLLRPTGNRSGFRDPKQQAEAWQRALKKYGSPEKASKWVARPGSSAHQSGRAIDFYLGASNSSGNVARLRQTRAYKWMVANASRFGFYSYKNEPWHWEYNPPVPGQQPELAYETYDRFELEDMFEAEIQSAEHLEAGPQPSSAAPPLTRTEMVPPAQTLYVKIPLGSEKPAKPITGIYTPQGFQPYPKVDLIVYLHGIKPRPDLAIDQYWNTKYFQYWPLRERLNSSQKNAILVAPTLGPRSQWQTGWLTKPGGLDRYAEKVLAALAAYGPYRKAKPQIGSIVLACHSGGGQPMRELALAQNKCARNIKECWGFDCTYFDADLIGWPRWARTRPDAKLYLYFRPDSQTQPRAKKIAGLKLANVTALTSSVGHNSVPIKHWQERLLEATFLRQTRSASTASELSTSSWAARSKAALEDWENYEPEAEEFEALDTELADNEWEDEMRRFRGLAARAQRPRMRSAPRRQQPQRQKARIPQLQPRPPKPKRPQRPGKRPLRRVGRAGRPIDPIRPPLDQASEYVRWVQISLNQILGLRLPITGVMNTAARSALRTFQGQQNLPVDGIAGPETRKALLDAKARRAGPGAQPPPSGNRQKPSSSSPSDEPSSSAPSEEPSPSAPSEKPSPPGSSEEPPSSGPSEEPASTGPSEEPPTQDPAPSEELEWLGANELGWGHKGAAHPFDAFMETEEVSLSGLPESVGKALRAGLESVAIKLALAAGARDETTLTNLVFAARHPERAGRKLTAKEPGFAALSREWLGIRDRLVRPATRAMPAPKRPSGAPSNAPAGELDIVAVRGIRVARQIAPKVEGLLAAAEADGIQLGGWGYRSRDKQIELRKSHCGPTDYDIYRKPSSLCTPPTAMPGKSMHEKGLAIDITHNGKTIKSQNSPAFQWLSRNAERFGLFNLPSEPWHWSVNGR